MNSAIVVTLVLTLYAGGDQFYQKDRAMDSIAQCLEEAAKVLEQAAKVKVENHDDAVEVGAGCVLKLDPGPPA